MHATAQEVARTYTEAALDNYKRHGHVAPMLALISDRVGVYAMIGAPNDVPEMGGHILLTLAGFVDPDFAVLVSETWTKSYRQEDVPEDIARGDLGRMAEAGDPEVYTAVMVYVLDCADHDRSHTLITVDRGGHMEESLDQPGLGVGRITDILVDAYAHSRAHPPPDAITLDLAISLLQTLGWASVTLVEMGTGAGTATA